MIITKLFYVYMLQNFLHKILKLIFVFYNFYKMLKTIYYKIKAKTKLFIHVYCKLNINFYSKF